MWFQGLKRGGGEACTREELTEEGQARLQRAVSWRLRGRGSADGVSLTWK